MHQSTNQEKHILYAKLSNFDVLFVQTLNEYIVSINGVTTGDFFTFAADAIESGNKLT